MIYFGGGAGGRLKTSRRKKKKAPTPKSFSLESLDHPCPK